MRTGLRGVGCALTLVFLGSCGDGGGGSNETPPAAAPTLSLAFGLKELRFSWTAVSAATFYQLFESVSGNVQIGGDLGALSYSHGIAVHRRVNASYAVRACNSGGCGALSAAVMPGISPIQAIGYLKASNPGNGHQFGGAVALSADGNTLAVGARFEDGGATGVNGAPDENAPDAGAVYVFRRGGGIWTLEAYVKPLNTAAGDEFGRSVALSADGGTLAVGTCCEDGGTTGVNSTPNEAATDSGAAYVFTRSSGIWSQQAYLKASNTGPGHRFGVSVALSGDADTLAVGADFEGSGSTGVNSTPDQAAPQSGAVYVFTRSGGVWAQQAYVKPLITRALEFLGRSVALSRDGNTLAASAPGEDHGTNLQAGAAYVFTRSAGSWSQQAHITPVIRDGVSAFGESVALSGDGNTLAVGAPLEASAATGVNNPPIFPLADAGAAYVFTRSGAAWSQQAYVKPSITSADDRFGVSVALSGDGDTLAVGALRDGGDSSGVSGTRPVPGGLANLSGAAYTFIRGGGVWTQQAYVKAPNAGELDLFGGAVALNEDGNTLAVGACCEDSATSGVNSTPNELASGAGAVYLY